MNSKPNSQLFTFETCKAGIQKARNKKPPIERMGTFCKISLPILKEIYELNE